MIIMLKLGMENVKIVKCSPHSLYRFTASVCDQFEISEVLGEFFIPRHENYIGESTKHYRKLSEYMIGILKSEGEHFYTGELGGSDVYEESHFVYVDRYKSVFIISKEDNTVVTVYRIDDRIKIVELIKKEVCRDTGGDEELEKNRMSRIKSYGMSMLGVKSARALRDV